MTKEKDTESKPGHISDRYLQAVNKNKEDTEKLHRTDSVAAKIASYNEKSSSTQSLSDKKQIVAEFESKTKKVPQMVSALNSKKLTFDERKEAYSVNKSSSAVAKEHKYMDKYHLKDRANNSNENLSKETLSKTKGEAEAEKVKNLTEISQANKVSQLSAALSSTLTVHKLMNVKYAEQRPELLQEITRLGLKDDGKSTSREDLSEDDQ